MADGWRFLDVEVAYVEARDGETLPAFLRRCADAVEAIDAAPPPTTAVTHVTVDYMEYDDGPAWSGQLVVE